MARLQSGQAIQVRYRDLEDLEVPSMVGEMSDTEVHLSFPSSIDLPMVFQENFPLTLKVIDRFGVHQGATTIVRVVTEPKVEIVVGAPKHFTTKQDREYFRIAYSVPLTIKRQAGAEPPVEQVRSEDISAGGVQFATATALEVNDEIEIAFQLTLPGPKTESFRFKSTIVRVNALSPKRHLVAAKFLNVGERQRELMVRWVFDLQRSLPTPK